MVDASCCCADTLKSAAVFAIRVLAVTLVIVLAVTLVIVLAATLVIVLELYERYRSVKHECVVFIHGNRIRTSIAAAVCDP